MNLIDITTATIAARLPQLRGTGSYFVTEVGDTYIQAACCNGDEVLIEICNEEFMQRTLPAGSDEELLRLGFTRPLEGTTSRTGGSASTAGSPSCEGPRTPPCER